MKMVVSSSSSVYPINMIFLFNYTDMLILQMLIGLGTILAVPHLSAMSVCWVDIIW